MEVIISWCLKKFHFYIVFSKPILFLLGMLFAHRLVDNAVFSIMVTYLGEEWSAQPLPSAATIVNLQEGTYHVMQILFAYIADAHSGLFSMVICSTALYIIGLLISYIAARQVADPSLYMTMFYAALALMTLSQAAERVTLKAFLGDQVSASDHEPIKTRDEEERALTRSKFWWYSVTLLAAIVAFFCSSKLDSFTAISAVSAVSMVVGFLLFLLGVKFYRRVKPTGSPLSDVVLVIYAAVTKRSVGYPETPEQLFENSSGLVQILPHVSWLRWLDRAAIEKPGHRIYTVEQVKEVKFLLKMLPMWTTFLTFSLVAATGSTFFLEEATNINDDFPVLFFVIFQRFTGFMVAEISDYILEKLGKIKNVNVQRSILVRIGVGMICCVSCCMAAWINAARWLGLVKKNKETERLKNNIFRLTPQFFLLGAMEGFSEDGLENFFDSQVSKRMSIYGPHFGECVMGVGKFMSAACIIYLSICIKWFKVEINRSRMDKYYAVLTILSIVNLVVYSLVAYWYGDDRFPMEDHKVDIERVQEVSLGPVPQRSRSNKWLYTESMVSTQSQLLQDDDVPLLNLKMSTQETALSSIDEVEKLDIDIKSTEQVLPDPTSGPSDGRLLIGIRSFPRVSSRRIHKRFYSMRAH